MKAAQLENRNLVRIDGEVAAEFLQNLVTCDVEALQPGEATFGALLTPQGKIQFDFFCIRTATGLLIDIDEKLRDDFIKRMMFYRLRAPVEIALAEDELSVYAVWQANAEFSNADDAIAFADPRLPTMGFRIIASDFPTCASPADYQSHRIAQGVPESGVDFALGEAFPHDALMDQFESKGAGVSFQKGCYVGQEVVSRMQHRGTARRRIVRIAANRALPPSGAAIEAPGRAIGTLGSVDGLSGLGLVRIDRLARAQVDGQPITCAGMPISAQQLPWAKYLPTEN